MAGDGWDGLIAAIRLLRDNLRDAANGVNSLAMVAAPALRATMDETAFVKSLFENIKSSGDPIIRNLLSQVVNLKTILDTTNLSWANAAALNRLVAGAGIPKPNTHECRFRQIGCNSTITGEITPFTCTKAGVYFDPYRFTADSGIQVSITMRSVFLDSVLQLVDDGYVVYAADDNGAGGLDAHISYRLPKGGTWTIVAGDRSFANGQYTLSLGCTVVPEDGFQLSAAPAILSMRRGESAEVRVGSTVRNFDAPISLSLEGVPPGITATLTPAFLPAPGQGVATVLLAVSPTMPFGSYRLVVRGVGGGMAREAGITVTVSFGECESPFIVSQPESQNVVVGRSAVLSVSHKGTSPFQHHWYRGRSGDESFPIEGATSEVFVTPPIYFQEAFWVRVRNGCGSQNSNAAVLTPVPPPTRQRPVRRP